MAKTIIGYFEQVSEAQRVLQDLLDHGFDRDHISLIAHQERPASKRGAPGRHTSSRARRRPGAGDWAPGRQPLKHDRRPLGEQPAGGLRGTTASRRMRRSGISRPCAAGGSCRGRDGRCGRGSRGGHHESRHATSPAGQSRAPTQRPRHPREETTWRRSNGRSTSTCRCIVAYQQWTRFEEFPQFMEGVEEVRRLDAKRLHWVANIGGTRKEWDAQITEEVPMSVLPGAARRGSLRPAW